MQIDLDYKDDFIIDFINYEKSKNSIANLSFDLEKTNKNFKIKKFKFSESTNLIEIENLKIEKNRYSSIKKILVKTDNNDFSVKVAQNENITVKGKKFDATNLAKLFKNQNGENKFEKLTGNVEIDFENINVPMSESLKNFKLIGL